MSSVDIIIALHATREYPAETCFVKCIETLKAHTQDYRLVLVDDACDDVARKVIEQIAQETQSLLIRTPKQKWFSRAYNAGLRMARTERTVILNADTELGPGWMEELYAVWDEASSQGHRVGLVGSVYSEPELRRWIATREPGFVTAHCWMVSMQALFDVSADRGQPGWYFDETNIKNAHIFSDNEVCYKMNRLGYSTIQSHKSAVGHVGGKSWGHNLARVFALKMEDVQW